MTHSMLTRAAVVAVALVAAIVLVLSILGGDAEDSAPRTGSLQIAGSETMRPVVTACAESFMAKNPQADVVVRGGGSGDGMAALLHGMIDLGMISRDLSPKERDYAKSKGIDLSIAELALDGIAIIVHRSNSLAELDFDQLKSIYAGKRTKWRDIGERDGDIAVVARASGSGTAMMFAERVLDGADAIAVQKLSTNEAIVAAVAEQPNAIGYTGLGAIRNAGDQVKVVAIRSDGQSAATIPTLDAVKSGAYPLTRTLYLVSAGMPSDIAAAFIAHCTGPAGQTLIQRAGYVVLPAASP